MTATVATLGGRIDPIESGFDRQLSNQVGAKATITQSLLMAWRSWKRMVRTPEQFADVAIQPILFTLMFAYIFGGAIAGNVTDYLPYMVPGIVVQSVLTMTAVTGTSLREDLDKGVFDRFKAMPMARVAPLAGATLADTVRFLAAGALTFVVGYVIGYRPEAGFGYVVVALVLVSLVGWAVAWIFALLGVLARTATAVQAASMAVMFPLTFCSNAFVDPDTMPSALRAFVRINPISHLVTALRELTVNGQFTVNVIWSLLGAGVIIAVFVPLTVRAYMRKL